MFRIPNTRWSTVSYHSLLAATLLLTSSASAASLLHHWTFDEASGSVVADSVGSAEMSIVGSNAGWTSGKDGEGVYYTKWINWLVTDQDNDPLTFTKVSGPDWLQVENASTGKLGGTPSSSDVGSNSFVIAVDDGVNPPVEATVLIEVIAAPNVAPVWSPQAWSQGIAILRDDYTASIAGNASDAEGDSLSFSKVSGPDWLSVSSSCNLSGKPKNPDLGVGTYVVSVSDGINTPVEATFTLEVVK